jgi:hypothetical protein
MVLRSKFDPALASSVCILASTNKSGDAWNKIIQDLNDSPLELLRSHDVLGEVDDPNGYLKQILTEQTLNSFNNNNIPPHNLELKVNDVCLVLRSLVAIGVATNTRVKILQIQPKCIKAQTIEEEPKVVMLRRIRFKFRLKYGQSYQMIRTQFPLRLAYCMTYNKSQSQTLDKVLLDCTEQPFAHGHLYVSLSRVRNADNIMLFIKKMIQEHDCSINDEDSGKVDYRMIPVVKNVIYPKALLQQYL